MGQHLTEAEVEALVLDPHVDLLQRLSSGFEGNLNGALQRAAAHGYTQTVRLLSRLTADMRTIKLDELADHKDAIQEIAREQDYHRKHFLELLVNAAEGVKPQERIAHKGLLVAHLEASNAIEGPTLVNIKRSLIFDTRCVLVPKRHLITEYLEALAKEEVHFIWTSLLGISAHAVDVVIQRDERGLALTTLNRGMGHLDAGDKHAGARRTVWSSAELLGDALFVAMQNKIRWKSMDEYHDTLHPNSIDADPEYRPQRIQKVGNCSTKSMLAAVNYLMTGPGPAARPATAEYKKVGPSLRAALGLGQTPSPTVRAYEGHREIKKLLAEGKGKAAVQKLVETRPADFPDIFLDAYKTDQDEARLAGAVCKRAVPMLTLNTISMEVGARSKCLKALRDFLQKKQLKEYVAHVKTATDRDAEYCFAATRHRVVTLLTDGAPVLDSTKLQERIDICDALLALKVSKGFDDVPGALRQAKEKLQKKLQESAEKAK